MTTIYSLFILMTVIFLAEALLHYIPWTLLLNGKRLHPTAAYILGVLGFLLPLSAWLLWKGQCLALLAVWVAVIAAGVPVLGFYLFDYVIDLVWSNREHRERENHGKKS